jgi:hypothetical protein
MVEFLACPLLYQTTGGIAEKDREHRAAGMAFVWRIDAWIRTDIHRADFFYG